MQWEWEPEKDRQNRQKHGVSFANAVGVFDDPLQNTFDDPNLDEERLVTIGDTGEAVLYVVHTRPVYDPAIGDETGRIISARKATQQDRREYDAGIFQAYR